MHFLRRAWLSGPAEDVDPVLRCGELSFEVRGRYPLAQLFEARHLGLRQAASALYFFQIERPQLPGHF